MLGAARPAPGPAAGAEPVRYLPCPECAALMNRVNFARCSGVVIDACREHGSWFDRDEDWTRALGAARSVLRILRG